jgi:hypothetical protein
MFMEKYGTMPNSKELLELANGLMTNGQKLVMSNHLRFVMSPTERDMIVTALRALAVTARDEK